MSDITKKILNQSLRRNRVRAKVNGTAERPRLSTKISNKHISAQIINDETGRTLASATTVGSKHSGTMSEKAAAIGKEVAEKAKKANVSSVVFDRGGRQYGTRLGSLADAARNEGLEF